MLRRKLKFCLLSQYQKKKKKKGITTFLEKKKEAKRMDPLFRTSRVGISKRVFTVGRVKF